MIIRNLSAKPILNSAGNWTIECRIEDKQNNSISASVPQGISTGLEEKKSSQIDSAVQEIEEQILPQIQNQDLNQSRLDKILETGNWGGNATLAVSAAFFKLENQLNPIAKQTIPKMMMLIFEGEEHGNPELTIQEFMVVTDKIEEGIALYQKAIAETKKQGGLDTVGSEGGMSPAGFTDNQILEIMKTIGVDQIALDVVGNVHPPTPDSLLEIVRRYPIYSLEDPFPEDQIDNWQNFFQEVRTVNPEILIVADDLTVTDASKIEQGANKLFNAVIIKPNQQGTISAAVGAVKTAKRLGIKTIASHRGQETNDDWIADFAIRFQTDYVKFGAPNRGERVAKYNRLIDND
ncbi:MAG: hypothetical protein ABID04_00180 [Patescibacteria group bacterium]